MADKEDEKEEENEKKRMRAGNDDEDDDALFHSSIRRPTTDYRPSDPNWLLAKHVLSLFRPQNTVFIFLLVS